MKKFLLALGLWALLASPAAAQRVKHVISPPTTVLSAVALNGAAGTRTFTLSNAEGYATLVLWTAYTHNNNGALTLTCTGGPAATDNGYTLTTCSTSSGTCTLQSSGVMATASLSANFSYEARLGIRGVHSVSCVIAHGGTPDGSDLVTVKASFATQ